MSNGRFESPVSRLLIEPKKSWHLLVGYALAQANPDAEVGLLNDVENAYFVVIPERVGGQNPARYTKQVRADFVTGLSEDAPPPKSLPSVTIAIDGRQDEFVRYRGGNAPRIEYMLCVHVREGMAYQILMWAIENKNRDSKKLLSEAVSCVKFLTPERTAALQKELLSLPDTENSVGPDWGLRRGVYRDYQLGMIWTKPRGFWRVTAGDAAMNYSEGTRVYAIEDRLGLKMDVSVEPVKGRALKDIHDDTARSYFEPDAKTVVTPIRTKIDERDALLSDGIQLVDQLTFRVRLLTMIQGENAILIRVFGFPKAMKDNADHVDAVIRGFRFPSRAPKPEYIASNTYRSRRIGVELTLRGTGWRINSAINPNIKAMGCQAQFQRANQNVKLIALTSLQPGQNASTIVKTVMQFLRTNLTNFEGAEPQDSTTTFASLEWKVQTWTSRTNTRTILHSKRDQTLYFLLVSERQGVGRPSLVKQVASGFRLVD